MKKIQLILLFLMINWLSAFGQIQKGNFLIGGTGSFMKQHVTNVSEINTIASLQPNFGYFVGDNFSIGIQLPLNYRRYGNLISTGFGISPMLRFYFAKNEKSAFFIPLTAGVGNNNYKTYGSSSKTIYTNYTETFGLGFVYFIQPNIGLETALSYYFQQSKNNIMANSNSSARGVNFNVGFQIYMAGRKTQDL